MVGADLTCETCGATHPPGVYPRGCPDCRERGDAGRLEVAYDPDGVPEDPLVGGEPTSMWDYRDLLPLIPDEPVTLGEGGTPLTPAEGLSAATGARVLLKNETVNPTWSYKDRLNALLLSNVAALGVDRVAVSSTGNHGASTAAYAGRAGVEGTVVLFPPETEPPVRAQARSYGAAVAVTDYDARGGLLRALVERGWYPTVNAVEGGYVGQPYTCEAYATIAFEVVDELGGVPDAVAVAVGAGDGLYGVWKGFRELRDLGVVEETPRMLAVEPAERAPLTRAIERGDGDPRDEGPIPRALSVGGATTGRHGLRAVRESGGTTVPVEEAAMERATREIAREGVLAEPASALAPAAVSKGAVETDETVIAVVTGAGVKWPAATTAAVGEVPEVEPTLDALDAALDLELTDG